ncbi:LacI family DNA-binding transcriptional regulator [Devosia sp.]|uniref:LacI family DNA-binding transcriptional regulator n=1 Tax=Devosia sp. TaxID=1871048 RepID=UPI00345B5694
MREQNEVGMKPVLKTSGKAKEQVTLQTVADAAGVSLATASKALSNTGRMKQETRDRCRSRRKVLQLSAERPRSVSFDQSQLHHRLLQ